MTEIVRIQDQLRRAFEGGAWHGPSVKEVLSGVNAAKALSRPIENGHTIWEIVLHIHAWENGVRRRIEGEKVELSAEEDWPPVKERTEATWKETLEALEKDYHRLQASIAKLNDSDLEKVPPGARSMIYVQLHGVIQHHLFHAGQIAILKK